MKYRKAHTMKIFLRIAIPFLALAASSAYSAEKGKAGLKLEFKIDGMLSPKIERAIVENVEENSSADIAGIIKGHKILKFGDCAIPGCKASIAKRIMNKSVGEIVILVLQKENGEIYTAKMVLQ